MRGSTFKSGIMVRSTLPPISKILPRYVVKVNSVTSRQTSTVFLGNTVKGDNTLTLADAKPFSALPGPAIYPFVGSIPAFYKEGSDKFHIALRNLRERYGDVYRFNILGLNTVAVADPDIVEEIYRKEGRFPRREPDLPAWSDYHRERNLSEGIVVMTGEEWWLHRTALNPKMLKVKQVETYGPDINDVSDDFLRFAMAKKDQSGIISGLETLLPQWSLESAATALLEKKLGSFTSSPDPRCKNFADASQRAFHEIILVRTEIPFLSRLFGSKSRKNLFDNLDIMYGTGTEIVNEKLKEFKEKEAAGSLDEETTGDLIPYLYHTKKMNVRDIISDILSLMFAAVETTSTTSLWALYFLGNHKDKQEKLRNELQTCVGDETFISAKALGKLPYLKAVIKETLRCGSVVPCNSRIFDSEVIINGCKAPEGTLFLLLHDAMSKDPKYFDDPDSFLPERWLRDKSTGESAVKRPFISAPFGFGPRMCLGRRLAELEIQILLSKIILQYDVECLQNNIGGIMKGLLKPEKPMQFKFIELNA